VKTETWGLDGHRGKVGQVGPRRGQGLGNWKDWVQEKKGTRQSQRKCRSHSTVGLQKSKVSEGNLETWPRYEESEVSCFRKHFCIDKIRV
jgi:hypothetical protein